MSAQEIQVPDIGDFSDVPVIEIHVAPGDTVSVDDPLITLESDKATLDVPAPVAGTVGELRVAVGDQLSQGSVIMTIDATGAPGTPPKERVHEDAHPEPVGPADYGSASGVYDRIEVTVPDIGDFDEVPVIEVHVAPGDTVRAEDPAASPSSRTRPRWTSRRRRRARSPRSSSGVGDGVSQGSVILHLQTADQVAAPPATAAATAATARPPATERGDLHAEVLVLGAGPGGYTAAFRAADLGKQVVVVDSRGPLGGVCLNVGCIPSKALLHAAKVIAETKEMSAHGVSFTAPTIDVDALRGWKDGVVSRLTGGLAGLAKQRKVTTISGTGVFTSMNQVQVTADDGTTTTVSFEHAIIAAGSEPVTLPFVPHDDPRVLDSTGALELDGIPERLLVLGGGIIGLEMATVYSELGSRVSVVELMDQLIPGADKDIVAPLTKRITKRYDDIWLKTKVTAVEAGAGRAHRPLRRREGPRVGRVRQGPGRGRAPPQRPNDRRRERRRGGGRARVHPRRQAAAHQRAAHLRHRRRRRPAHARAQGRARRQGRRRSRRRQPQLLRRHRHPLGRLHRPRGRLGRRHRERGQGRRRQVRQGRVPVGRQRPLAVPGPRRGHHQGPLRREHRTDHRLRHRRPQRRRPHRRGRARHRMGADAADIGLTIHPHPTLSETIAMAAEAFEGTITDLYMPKKKK